MPKPCRQTTSAPLMQLPLFYGMMQIASFAPEPPRNPDPPPKRSLCNLDSEDDSAKGEPTALSSPSTLRDKLMERRRRDAWDGR